MPTKKAKPKPATERERIDALLEAMRAVVELLPERWRVLGGTMIALLAALVAALWVTDTSPIPVILQVLR